jgi:hypothetical protein
MGSIRGEDSAGEDNNSTTESTRHADDDVEDEEACSQSGELWPLGAGADYWQATAKGVRERISRLHNGRDMSDVCVLASDENWWFGDTVKDFTVSEKECVYKHGCDGARAKHAERSAKRGSPRTLLSLDDLT